MVCRRVRKWVQQSCPLNTTNMSFTVTKLALKAPRSILVSAGIVGSALQDGLRRVPVVGSVDVTSMPVVGPFVSGVRAAQAARGVTSKLDGTTTPFGSAPFADVRARTEAPIGLVGNAREANTGKLEVTKDGRIPMGKKNKMPLPDWF